MTREYVEPTVDQYGSESHPAWGTIHAHRSHSTGTHLFGVLTRPPSGWSYRSRRCAPWRSESMTDQHIDLADAVAAENRAAVLPARCVERVPLGMPFPPYPDVRCGRFAVPGSDRCDRHQPEET